MQLLLAPEGRIINFTPGDTLLDTLLQHRVPISHSCRDGRCGLCQCSIAEGTGVAPYGMDAAINVEPLKLACQTILKGDCAVEIPDREDIVVHPPRLVRAKVLEILAPRRDIRLLRLKPSGNISFSPGQHMQIRWTPTLKRPYSMAGLPDDKELNFHIKLHNGGRASQHIECDVKVGDTLRLEGPLGTSYLRSHHRDPIICISIGTGLGPLLALLREIARTGIVNPIYVYAGFTLSEEVYGLDLLESATDNIPSAKRVQVLVGCGALDRKVRRGLVTDALTADFENLTGWRAYVFGSVHATETTERILRDKGVDRLHIYAEPFHYANT